MHANCSSFIQPAYGVYNHKPEKNPYSTIKLIVSSPFFSPYRVHFYYSSHHLLKGACTAGEHTDGGEEGGGKKKEKEAEQG